jgi:hypothetical protein
MTKTPSEPEFRELTSAELDSVSGGQTNPLIDAFMSGFIRGSWKLCEPTGPNDIYRTC